MSRRKVVAIPYPYKCPLCGRHSQSLRGLAMHLAMKRDPIHVSWRCGHGLPGGYERMGEVAAMVKTIEDLLKRNGDRYRVQEAR